MIMSFYSKQEQYFYDACCENNYDDARHIFAKNTQNFSIEFITDIIHTFNDFDISFLIDYLSKLGVLNEELVESCITHLVHRVAYYRGENYVMAEINKIICYVGGALLNDQYFNPIFCNAIDAYENEFGDSQFYVKIINILKNKNVHVTYNKNYMLPVKNVLIMKCVNENDIESDDEV